MLNPPTQSPSRPYALSLGEIVIGHAGYRLVRSAADTRTSIHPDWRLFWCDHHGVQGMGRNRTFTMHDRLVVVVPPLQPFGRAAAVPFVSVHLYFRCAWPVARDALHVVPVADVLTRHLYDFAGAMEHGHDHIAACTATGLIALVLAQIPALPVSRDQAIARLVLA